MECFWPEREGGRVGISKAYFKDKFSHNIPYIISATFRKDVFKEQRNKKSSASQYLRVCLLNPCPKLIDVLI